MAPLPSPPTTATAPAPATTATVIDNKPKVHPLWGHTGHTGERCGGSLLLRGARTQSPDGTSLTMPDLYATSGAAAMVVDVVVQVVVFGSGAQVASEAATGGVALLDERRG